MSRPATTTDPRSALLGVYKPADPLFVRGDGASLVDSDGRRYLDFTSGIAVTALGHGHPRIREAVEGALDQGMVHTSNLYRTRPGEELAARLAELSGLDRVFFCNSGGEAVEGALKFARRWARTKGGSAKHGFVSLKGAFHGRLFGSLALTDRPEYQEPFQPLMPGVRFVDPEDPEALDGVDPQAVAALVAEPIQGEGGVRPLPEKVLRRLREWTQANDVLLVLDEIQCGLGRTGEFFAYQASGILPDILTLAKPLAGGLPMGAVVMTEEVAETIQPGDHGTTFGGGPLVSAVARAVVDTVAAPDFLEEVQEKGQLLHRLLQDLQSRHSGQVQELRGRGLMWGVELTGQAGPVVEKAREAGLLLVPAGKKVVRLLPPLTVTTHELERGVGIMGSSLA